MLLKLHILLKTIFFVNLFYMFISIVKGFATEESLFAFYLNSKYAIMGLCIGLIIVQWRKIK